MIAFENSVEKIRKHLKADSLNYLSLDGLVKATKSDASKFCLACLTGVYPVEVPHELKVSKLMLEKVTSK